jgi:Alpha-kinase family
VMVRVKIEPKAFARGSNRLAYHMQQLPRKRGSQRAANTIRTPTKKSIYVDGVEEGTSYVVKISVDPYEDARVCFKDVETQLFCAQWADRFNSYNPPKRVQFIACSVMELIDRANRPL